ncbi:hypothetical protein ABT214_19185, partial [Micromonospora purpureochromogenes]
MLLAGAEQEAHCLGLHALAAALREQGRGCLLLGPALPWAALAAAVARVRPHTVLVWSQTPLTGRAYRLVRFGRDFPRVRLFGAGPGWIEPFPPPSVRLTTFAAAVAACGAGGSPWTCRWPAPPLGGAGQRVGSGWVSCSSAWRR